MLESLVTARRKLRKLKNNTLGRTIKETKYMDDKFIDVIKSYITESEVKIFGFDTKERAHIFRTNNYNDILNQNKVIEHMGLIQSNIYYEKYSGKKSTVHYFDVNYYSKNRNLILIAKVEQKK